MNKRGMGIFTLVLLLFALGLGATIIAGDISPEIVEEVKNNFTISHMNFTMPDQPELGNALEYWVNGVIQAYVELTKWIMTYVAEHPEVPYKWLFILLIISIAAPIIVSFVKLLIIIFLLIREFFQSRKEKQLIKSYKGGKRWT